MSEKLKSNMGEVSPELKDSGFWIKKWEEFDKVNHENATLQFDTRYKEEIKELLSALKLIVVEGESDKYSVFLTPFNTEVRANIKDSAVPIRIKPSEKNYNSTKGEKFRTGLTNSAYDIINLVEKYGFKVFENSGGYSRTDYDPAFKK